MQRAETAVLNAKLAVVAQEHHPVASGKATLATLNLHGGVFAKCAAGKHPLARGQIEFAHFVIGVREDDAAVVRPRDAFAIPTVDQLAACSFARLGGVNHAMFCILTQSLGCSARCKMAGCIALPVHLLPPDFGNLDASVMFGNRAERRARFDCLQLLRIANQNDLGSGIIGGG